MKKNLLIIIIIALFICTNIATFLFAHGRVQIIEKVVTMDKEAREPSYAASLGKEAINDSLSRRDTYMPQAVGIGEDPCHFDNPDYPIDEDTGYPSDNDKDANPDVDLSADKQRKTASDSEQSIQQGGAFYPDSGQSPGYTAPSTEGPFAKADEDIPLEGPFAKDDEDIPLPQLPLWDGDFEVATSEDDFSGTPPPVLPIPEEE